MNTRDSISQTDKTAEYITTKLKNSVAWVRKRIIPPPVGEVSANFSMVRGCHVISVTDPYSRILGFLDRGRYFLF
jgi:hypothetical protein